MLTTLNKDYKTSSEWDGEKYTGLTINWDYSQQMVHISMPGYCDRVGQCFRHNMPPKNQDGTKQQYAADKDTSPKLSKEEKTYIQEVIGVFLYYA